MLVVSNHRVLLAESHLRVGRVLQHEVAICLTRAQKLSFYHNRKIEVRRYFGSGIDPHFASWQLKDCVGFSSFGQ